MSRVGTIVNNELDRYKHFRLQQREIKKFNDPRRKKIQALSELTKKQKEEIDRLYLENYGEKIPYTWHQHYTAFTGKFDVNYFPELIFIPEFERFMNLWPQYTHTFTDKNIIPLIASNAKVKTPECLLSCTRGMYRIGYDHAISKAEAVKFVEDLLIFGGVFCKPTLDTGSGFGCFVADFSRGVDLITGRSVEEVLNLLGNDFVIQERLKCHKSVADLHSESVNTFRIITYRWGDEILYAPALMRIGRGQSYLDNAHAGGIFIAIDPDGQLHKNAYTEFNEIYDEHPDSKLVFESYKIELFPKVLEAAIKMHELIPQVGCINWDFTLDESGNPVLIESNMRGGSIWLSEMSHGCGPFGEKTPEILMWLRLMKKTPPTERAKYAFGKM